jgi:hypothetical protein
MFMIQFGMSMIDVIVVPLGTLACVGVWRLPWILKEYAAEWAWDDDKWG